jgi:uncharacterized protein (TIGR02271 family)
MPVEENFDRKHQEASSQGEGRTIPIIEEQVRIDKKVVETGKVHLSKVVHEEVERYNVPYTEEEVSVERVTKNEFVEALPPAIRYEDGIMIISVLKEVPVVEKKLMLIEELRVTKTKTERIETQEVSLRKEKVEINRTQPDHLA